MRRSLVLLLLCACNQIYGLDETVGPAPIDSDQDGIADEDDNCVLVVNDGQANADGDTFGDACDPCPAGPQSGVDADKDGIDDTCDECPRGANHDEDGDALLDGCDNCPGIANADQLDADSDEVGDMCDARPSDADTRTFFEAFAPPDPSWSTGFSTWTPTGEGFAAETIVMGPGPWHPRAAVAGTTWQVTTSLRLPASPAEGARVGLAMIQTNGQTVLSPYCTIERVFDRWEDSINGLPVTVSDPLLVTLEIVAVDASTISARCTINGQAITSNTTYPAAKFYPMLYVTHAGAEFHYLDVVQ